MIIAFINYYMFRKIFDNDVLKKGLRITIIIEMSIYLILFASLLK